jgi:hypothetical protein
VGEVSVRADKAGEHAGVKDHGPPPSAMP